MSPPPTLFVIDNVKLSVISTSDDSFFDLDLLNDVPNILLIPSIILFEPYSEHFSNFQKLDKENKNPTSSDYVLIFIKFIVYFF